MTESRKLALAIAGTVVLVGLLVVGALFTQTDLFRKERVRHLLTRFAEGHDPVTARVLAEYLDGGRLNKTTGDQVLFALTEPSAEVKSQYFVGENVVITYSFPCDVRFRDLYLHRTSHPFIGEKEMIGWGQWPENSIHAGVPYPASFDKGVGEAGTYSGRIAVVHKAYPRQDKDRQRCLYEARHVLLVQFHVTDATGADSTNSEQNAEAYSPKAADGLRENAQR